MQRWDCSQIKNEEEEESWQEGDQVVRNAASTEPKNITRDCPRGSTYVVCSTRGRRDNRGQINAFRNAAGKQHWTNVRLGNKVTRRETHHV